MKETAPKAIGPGDLTEVLISIGISEAEAKNPVAKIDQMSKDAAEISAIFSGLEKTRTALLKEVTEEKLEEPALGEKLQRIRDIEATELSLSAQANDLSAQLQVLRSWIDSVRGVSGDTTPDRN